MLFLIFINLLFCQSYKISGDRLYGSRVASVVFINSDYNLGSGIVISEDGHIITNYHVVEGLSSEDLDFYFYDGIQNYSDLIQQSDAFEGEIIYIDKSKDLALLKVYTSQDNIYPIEFADPQSTSVGSQVFAIGHPTGEDFNNPMLWSFTEGIINRIAREEWSYGVGGLLGWWTGEDNYTVNVNTIFTQTPINSGNSGGLLMNAKGKMIGVNTWSDENMMNVSGAINIDEVITFISDSGINTSNKYANKKDSWSKTPSEEIIFNFEEIIGPKEYGGIGFRYHTYLDRNEISVEMVAPEDEDDPIYILLDLNLDGIGNVMLYDIEDDESFSYWSIDIDLDGYIDWEGDIIEEKKKKKYEKLIDKIEDLLIETFAEIYNQGFLDDW